MTPVTVAAAKNLKSVAVRFDRKASTGMGTQYEKIIIHLQHLGFTILLIWL